MSESKAEYVARVISLEPQGAKDNEITNFERAIATEYIRVAQYQQFISSMDASETLETLDLWLWANRIGSEAPLGKEPIFFQNNKIQSYPDELLIEDKDIIERLRKFSGSVSRRIKKQRKELEEEDQPSELRTKVGTEQVSLVRKGMSRFGLGSLVIDKADYNRLINILRINSELSSDPAEYIEISMLRNSMVESITPVPFSSKYYKKLEDLGTTAQLFATPLDHYFASYGSEFYDIDRYFGSFGSIMKDESANKIFTSKNRNFEANLLQYGPMHSVVVAKLNILLLSTSKKIVIFIVHDISVDSDEHREEDTYVANYPYHAKQLAREVALSRNLLILKSKSASAPAEKDLVDLRDILSEGTTASGLPAGGVSWQSLPILTAYEKAVALGTRAQELAKGAPPAIDAEAMGLMDPLLVAEIELEQGKLQIIVHRPDRDWDVNELIDYDTGNYLYDEGSSFVGDFNQ